MVKNSTKVRETILAKDRTLNSKKLLISKLEEKEASFKNLPPVEVQGAGKLVDNTLIAELKAAGIKFTEADWV